MKYFLILLLIFGVMILPAEEKKPKLVKKQLMPDAQKEKKTVQTPTGKREPFKDLMESKKDSQRRRGNTIEDLTIAEVKLEGIIKMKDGKFRAMLVSPKGKTFIVTVGQKLYDGEIVKITFQDVIFKKMPPVSLPKL